MPKIRGLWWDDGAVVRPFPLRDQVPDVLRGVIPDIHWDMGKLHELPGLVEVKVPVGELAWHLRLPFWSHGGIPFRVCPQDVLDDPDRYREQWARTLACDLRFPLHARVNHVDRVVILDGIHRLLKATLLGQDSVQVRVVTDEDLAVISV
ncbi:hypothetical protein [Mycobacterium intracellulare]|uniref:hypothetical protein n=1 Tax=Mycobacterium intracellulare TaxID=1767 RepID=UPI0030C87714